MGSDQLHIKIGEKLRRVRKARKQSLKFVCEKIGIATPVLSRHEDGSRQIPLERLISLCKHYKISASELLADVEEVQPRTSPIKDRLKALINSQEPLDQKISLLVEKIAEHANLEIVTTFEYQWSDNSLRRISTGSGEYLSPNLNFLSDKTEKGLRVKYKGKESAEYDTLYYVGKYITGEAWEAWRHRHLDSNESSIYIPSYHEFVARQQFLQVNKYSYELHEKLLGTHVRSTMYGVISVIYPRFLLRVFNRSDIRNAPISRNQYQIFSNLCDFVSECFAETLSSTSLKEIQDFSQYFSISTNKLEDKLEKLNAIISKNELPPFIYLIRSSASELQAVNSKELEMLSSENIKFLLDQRYSEQTYSDKYTTPTQVQAKDGEVFLIFPMNDYVVLGGSSSNDTLTSVVENRGVAVLPLGYLETDTIDMYQALNRRVPDLSENIDQYIRLATGIVSL